MINTLAEKIRNEYRKIAKRQHARFGNHLGESSCAEPIATVLVKAVEDSKLTLPDALKMCQPFAKAEYGEYGLTPGTVYPILSKYISDHWYRTNMEVKLTYIDR